MRQIDLFGNEIDVKDLKTTAPKNTIRWAFRKVYGFNHKHTCKDCTHLVCKQHNNKNYYKCAVMGITDSEATDIRLKDVACGMWERKEDGKTDRW